MRVVSVNAWCGVMLEPLMQWLSTVGADVLCIQEVTWTVDHPGWVTYADPDRSLHQRSSLFDDLRLALPAHQAHFYANDTGPVLTPDGAGTRQQFGIATFIAPQVAVVGSASAFVHGGFAHHDQWPAEDRPRTAHAVRVIGDDGQPVVVAHFHGVRMRHGKGDDPGRREQAEKVARLVQQVAQDGDLIVVAGDMNVLPGSETLKVLESRLGLVDLVGTADTRTSAYLKPTRHASYLLVSDPSAVTEFDVLASPEVSDHRPLVLDL